ncbi:type III PLP-dependent enzyme [Pseudogemmobacter sp. W21_MBD1_M6]|uniref:type III PLP-dependent enzyme n=1 Tax=Pseudogemmobacter sp. W21_MBD1_M6 TaxID=3240271 RepID=UPI003F9BEEFD
MSRPRPHWSDPAHYLRSRHPDTPVLFFRPHVLHDTARAFLAGFDGLVTYAVKANDTVEVLDNLIAAGITGFDVASPHEMRLVRRLSPTAALHYNNPVRSPAELAVARAAGVVSYSIDDCAELDKLLASGPAKGIEVAVRLKLPVAGAAYDFGAKFGVLPDHAVNLLRRVAAFGFVPAMTFHVGTQCADPQAWNSYIHAAADVAARAGVTLARLNVGGGFASHRTGAAPDLASVFATIRAAVAAAFGPNPPALVCEPGRAMVADAYTLAARVKAVRTGGAVFLNDGIYGSLAELAQIGVTDRITVLAADGAQRRGPRRPCVVFGPTCDSLDRLPTEIPLPSDLAEGDYVLFDGVGAYSTAMATRFNGYGQAALITLQNGP